MVVPGTPRDSLHILDALLHLDGGVKPEMVATDNASYSDMVLGLFEILGYNFSPRFRDLDDPVVGTAFRPAVGLCAPVTSLFAPSVAPCRPPPAARADAGRAADVTGGTRG
jgi:hypothetical protein